MLTFWNDLEMLHFLCHSRFVYCRRTYSCSAAFSENVSVNILESAYFIPFFSMA